MANNPLLEKEILSERHRIEKKLHDEWAKTINICDLSPSHIYNCPTTPESTYSIDCLGEVSGKNILDLGCGSGETSVFLTEQGANVTSVDVSLEMAIVTKKLGRKFNAEDKIHPALCAGEKLCFKDESFDLVYGQDVLHHLDLEMAASEILRVLRPTGKAVFSEPLCHNQIIEFFRKLTPEVRTPTEIPLKFNDIKKLAKHFSRCRHVEFQLSTLMIFLWFFILEKITRTKSPDRYWKKIIIESEKYKRVFNFFESIDRIIFTIVPFLSRYCRMTVIVLEK